MSVLLVGGAHSASQASGLIAFTRSDGIYVMRADGSDFRAVRRGGVAKYPQALAWSPDGRKLAFAAGGIWVMNADGSELVRLANVPAWGVTWSPDGRKIAFTGSREGDSDIWVMNANGSGKDRLLRTPRLNETDVDWSPVGNRIAFSAWAYPTSWPGPTDIYVVQANGRKLRKLTPGTQPEWSPDGRRIVFVRGGSYQGAEIYVLDAGGRSLVRVTRNTRSEGGPVWSPDGTEIAFMRGEVARVSFDIYVMNADGTGVTGLTHSRANEANPEWQPVAGRAPQPTSRS